MFTRPINKPLNIPVIFYSSSGTYTPWGYDVKNTIKKPIAQDAEEEKKKYKFYQKHKK